MRSRAPASTPPRARTATAPTTCFVPLSRRSCSGDGAALAETFATAPGAAIYRHLWRALVDAEAIAPESDVQATVFALPVVIVAGLADGAGTSATLPGVLSDTAGLASILREHGALAGNQTFALATALAAAETIDLAHLPRLLAPRSLAATSAHVLHAPVDLAPAPIALAEGHESVHVRFIVGIALAAAGVDLVAARDGDKWGMQLARAIGVQLAVPGASVLALPHAPLRLVPALADRACAPARGGGAGVPEQRAAADAGRHR